MATFASMKLQTCAINRIDFLAMKQFEKLYPSLYTNAKRPISRNDSRGHIAFMTIQMNAFNALFYSETYAAEFKALIASAPDST